LIDMPQHDLLMIDDDAALGHLLSEYLGRFGHSLRQAETAATGLAELRRRRPDLLILDIMLPDRDGLSVCRTIRTESDVPILMLTARGEVADRVVGLEMGADDYLPKPFEPRELVARIETILRRAAAVPPSASQASQAPQAEAIECGPLRLDPATRTVHLGDRRLDLTTTEHDLLRGLMESRGRVLSREQILAWLHGPDAESFDRSIDMLISRLRHKLGDDPRSPRFIKTIWRVGYQFVAGTAS
jgi:DNA-binding response OmpR family regulator